jgi:copper chaperone NosL
MTSAEKRPRPRPMRWRSVACLAVWLVACACHTGPPAPAALDPENDICTTCHMLISDPRFASQIVAPNEEPRFFDDLGCLHAFLVKTPLKPSSAVYVADHRTKAWVAAADAVYSAVDAPGAPMGSRFIAHESTASRDADPDARGATPATVAEVFAGVRLPGGGL